MITYALNKNPDIVFEVLQVKERGDIIRGDLPHGTRIELELENGQKIEAREDSGEQIQVSDYVFFDVGQDIWKRFVETKEIRAKLHIVEGREVS